MKTPLKAGDRSLFGEGERSSRRSKLADPLVGFLKHVDFGALADKEDKSLPRPSRAKGSRPPYPTAFNDQHSDPAATLQSG